MFSPKTRYLPYSRVIMLLTTILLLGCGDNSLNQPSSTNKYSLNGQSNLISPSKANTLRILPLGDSITQGGNGFPSYRRSLWFMLKKANHTVDFVGTQSDFASAVDNSLKDFDLDHEGHWAWEAGAIEEKLPRWLKNYTPDIVLLHAGTNDVDRGQGYIGTINELERIIDLLRNKNAKVVVLLAKIVPMKNKDTHNFNQFIEALVLSKHTSNSPIVLVDQYSGYFPATDSYDNYHPNASGEEKMATRWFNALQPYL